jgi:hypothetical protein
MPLWPSLVKDISVAGAVQAIGTGVLVAALVAAVAVAVAVTVAQVRFLVQQTPAVVAEGQALIKIVRRNPAVQVGDQGLLLCVIPGVPKAQVVPFRHMMGIPIMCLPAAVHLPTLVNY